MHRAATSLLLFAITCVPAFARPQLPSKPPQKPDPDRLGMTCAQILKMPATDWAANFNAKATPSSNNASAGLSRSVAVYGKCYDARTDAQAALLARTGKGPTKAARADFAAFEAALKDFADKAIADAATPPDESKKAYAALYERQFRYQFYEEYEAKTVRPAKPSNSATTSTPSTAAPTAAAQPPAAGTHAATAATAEERARSDADPVTQAKNRFGKLLEVLPDDKMHELHRAFGEVIGPHQISEATRLAAYRFAIFILEPPSAKPFSPPPF